MWRRDGTTLGAARNRLGFLSWPTVLIGIVVIKAALSLAVKPGSFLVSYSGISYFLLLLLATSFATRNAIQNTLGSRAFWIFLAIAYGLWSFDQWIYIYYELFLHVEVPENSIADPVLFLHIVPIMAAVATLPHRNANGRTPFPTILNSIFLLLFWGSLYVYFVVPYQYLVSNTTGYALRFDALYLLENWAMVLAIGVLILRMLPPWKAIYLHLLGASILYALSSAFANLAIDSGGYVNGKLYGLGLTASVCWFAWIPLCARPRATEGRAARSDSGLGLQTSAWPMILVVLISVPIVWELLKRDEQANMRTFRLLVAITAIVSLSAAAYIKEYLAKSDLASSLALANNRLRSALRAGKSVGWEWDLKSGRDFWFGDLQTIFGISSDTFVGQMEDFYRYVHPEDRQLVAKAVSDARQKRTPYTAVFRIVRLDGSVRWISARGRFYYGANGEAERMLGMASDITERKQVEEALRESEERFRLATQAGKMFAYEWDAATDAIVRSEDCTQILGIDTTAHATTGQEILAMVPPDDREKLLAADAALSPENPHLQVSHRMVRPDGGVIWVERTGRAHFDKQGKLLRIVGMVANVTERKQAEHARAQAEHELRESEQRFRLALQAGRMYAFDWDVLTDVIVRSPESASILSWTDPKPCTGGAFYATVHPDDREVYTAAETGLTPENPTYKLSFRTLRPDGGVTWLEDAGRASFDAQGRMLRVIGIVSDITERKRVEEAHRESEDKFRLLLDSTAEAIYGIDVEHRCTFCNRACLAILGCERVDDLVGKNMHELIHHTRADGTSFPIDECRIHRVVRTGQGEHVDDEFLWRANGTSFPAEYWSYPQRKGQAVVGTVVAFLDITQRKLAEAALANVSRKLIEAQEQERTRIARELHDDIGQRVAMLAIELEQIRQNFPDLPAEVSGRIVALWKQANEMATDVQSMSHELHSAKLQYLGITAAMRGFCQEFGQQQKVEIGFTSHDLPLPLSPDISICLFRVLQEALHNSAKHSGGRHFEVRLWGMPDEVHLTVSDSGVGFDSEAAKTGQGLGLISMRERLKLVNGTLSVESRPKSGTTIHARVPLSSGRDLMRAIG